MASRGGNVLITPRQSAAASRPAASRGRGRGSSACRGNGAGPARRTVGRGGRTYRPPLPYPRGADLAGLMSAPSFRSSPLQNFERENRKQKFQKEEETGRLKCPQVRLWCFLCCKKRRWFCIFFPDSFFQEDCSFTSPTLQETCQHLSVAHRRFICPHCR